MLRRAEDIATRGLPLLSTLEDIKLSIQATIAPHEAIAQLFATANAMRFGRSERVNVIQDVDVLTAGWDWAAVFAQAGWRGPLNIQGHRDADGAITIYEYNGRFTGATAARNLLGFDEVGRVLRDWLGFVPPAVEIAPAREVVCYLAGRALDATKVGQLKCEAYWAGAANSRITLAGDP